MAKQLTITVPLYESDFDCNQSLKRNRAMELMQNVATDHAASIGCGWNELDKQDMLWILYKIKLRYLKVIDKSVKSITIVTTPQKPERLLAERQCYALDENGNRLFESVAMWMVIGKSNRKILPISRLENYINGEFGQNTVSLDNKFCKVIEDDEFRFAYDFVVRRSLLDANGHVNNTHYVTFAEDALSCPQKFSQVEVTFSHELKPNSKVAVLAKETDCTAEVIGTSDGVQCFSAKFTM